MKEETHQMAHSASGNTKSDIKLAKLNHILKVGIDNIPKRDTPGSNSAKPNKDQSHIRERPGGGILNLSGPRRIFAHSIDRHILAPTA
jgi:hypothetical protein